MTHVFVTVAVPFDAKRTSSVEAALDSMGNPATRAVRDLLRSRGIHFMSMGIVPADLKHGAFLVLEASADEGDPKKDVVSTIVESLGQPLIGVFGAAGLPATIADVESALRKHSHTVGQDLLSTPGLCFAGTPDTSLKTIRDEYELNREVRKILESGAIRGTPLQILNQVRAHIEAKAQREPDSKTDYAKLLSQHASPLLSQPPMSSLPIPGLIVQAILIFTWPYLLVALALAIAIGVAAWMRIDFFWGLVAFTFALFCGLVGFVALGGWIYVTLRGLEATDVPDNSAPDPVRLANVVKHENRTEQNHLFAISTMKQGWIRNLLLRVVYWVIVQVATTTSKPGFLGELGTIHFARWILLPGTDKLLFFSNYGGSWESYLEDFITKAHAGLTGVWSNTVGYPRTNNLFADGATDGDRFKRWARRQQHPTRFWYSAYPYLSTDRIRINSAIRQGLASAATEDEAAQWLSCMGSRPRQGAVIENDDVQGILFGGFRPLCHGACLMLRLPPDSAQARSWLADVERGVSFGDAAPGRIARLIAITKTGLFAFGCDQRILAEFPVAFQEGMSSPGRAASLCDTGDDDPKRWAWGHGERAVDVAILIYADSQATLDDDIEAQRAKLTAVGGQMIERISLARYDPKMPIREPFGFVDGISQPIVRGTRRWISESDANHVVEPGEFLLGYPDNRGFLPLTPFVPATSDPHNVLPAYRDLRTGELPDFTVLAGNGPRDLGRNGSYLVIRQLKQNVARFNGFLDATATHLKGRAGVPASFSHDQIRDWLAAKVIGRWRDGTSLVRYPHEPGKGWNGERDRDPDNSFLSGAEDPLGERCPFGAHIRRTNPRDSLVPGSMEQLGITNRHRILRVGRVYVEDPNKNAAENPPPGDGLLFMCLNADIERQFEFIQQTWASARLFHGLDGEVDPILGRGGLTGRLTIPTEEGPILITGIADFVTVRGGAYFFLPGRRAIWYLAGKTTTAVPAGAGTQSMAGGAAMPSLPRPTTYGRIALERDQQPDRESVGSGDTDVRPAWDDVH